MNIVRYEDWAIAGLDHPGGRDLSLPVDTTYVHHTVTPQPSDAEAEVSQLRQIDKDHRRKGWNGIGYNFIVGPSGTVYEGRGQKAGAHNDGENSTSFGICFLGTFTKAVPTPAAMMAAANLMRHLIASGALTSDFAMRAHGKRRDGSPFDGTDATACPGNALYRDLPTLYRLVTEPPAPINEETPMSDRIKVNAPCVGAIAAYDADGNVKGYALIGADYGVFCFGEGVSFLGNVEYVVPADDNWLPAAE